MKWNLLALAWLLSAGASFAQSLDFARTPYFTRADPNSQTRLSTTGATLTSFNYSGADTSHPLFQDGLFFPIRDFQNNNLWVRLRHIAHDGNGPTVGVNNTATSGDPFRAGLGGWGGFLYRFDIYRDSVLTGAAGNVLAGDFATNITVESLETLSQPEWVNFNILNAQASAWALNSINFTGNNPGSNPGFSDTSMAYPTGTNPPAGYSTTFPTGSRMISVVDYGGASFAEFRMSADRVSSFTYGYEYNSSGGYQGMNLHYGIPSGTAVRPNAASGLVLKAYPTAAADRITLSFAQPTAQTAGFFLIDALGRRTPLGTMSGLKGQKTLSLAGLNAGVYWLVMETATGTAATRIVKL